MKKLLSVLLVIMLVLGNLSMACAEENLLITAQQPTKRITVIHTNDTHSRVLDSDGGFGFAKITSFINEIKASNPNTLVMDAGDTLHGLPIINISKGKNAVKTLNAAGYDYMTPGNHDFNYGQKRLVELNNMAEFDMLSANIMDAEGNYLFKPYDIIEMDGVKVAVFGLTTPETAYKTSPINVEGITFADPIEASKKMVEELNGKADVIIALAHVGLDTSSTVTSEQIAAQVDGIDVIIDGHSHTVLTEGKMVNNTLIAQTGEYDINIGIVEIEIAEGRIVNKTAKLANIEDYAELAADETVAQLLAAIDEENKPLFSEVVASTDIYLDGVRDNVRTKETNLGNLSADAVRWASKADIGFVNGGSIRTEIQPGDITLGDAAKLFPFGNRVIVLELTAQEIIEALEISVQGYPAASGGFLQVSGLTYKFSQDKEIGSKVYEVKIGGELIDTAQELATKYTVAVNDFLAIGGDDYEIFVDKPIVAEIGTCEEVFADYLNTNGTKGCEVTGRIIEAAQSEQISSEAVYVVVSGDVLWKIAQKYNTTWEMLAEYNKLDNPHLIFPNQKILIPLYK